MRKPKRVFKQKEKVFLQPFKIGVGHKYDEKDLNILMQFNFKITGRYVR